MAQFPTRRCIVLILIALSAATVLAQDTTSEYLAAPVVQQLSLYFDGTQLKYKVGPEPGSTLEAWSLAGQRTVLVARGPVNVRYLNFNPLTVGVTVTTQETEDKNLQGLSKIADAIIEYGKTVMPGTDKAATDEQKTLAAASGPCVSLDNLRTALHEAERAIREPVLTKEIIQQWISSAAGFDGMKSVQTDVGNKATAASNRRDEIQKQWNIIDSYTSDQVLQAEDKAKKTCTAVKASMFALAAKVGPRAATAMKRNEALAKQLTDVAALLGTYVNDKQRWAGNDYLFPITLAPLGKNTTIKVALTPKTLSVSDDEGLVFTSAEKPAVTSDFEIRRHFWLIPEVGIGPVYNEIDYPSYGTANVGGQTLVVRTKPTADNKVEAALLVSGIFRTGGESWVNPLLQFGVSTAKNVPGILFGGGFRFGFSKPVVVSGGRLWTRVKDLEHLHPNDPVSGTADIQNDLTRERTAHSWYLSVQYEFK